MVVTLGVYLYQSAPGRNPPGPSTSGPPAAPGYLRTWLAGRILLPTCIKLLFRTDLSPGSTPSTLSRHTLDTVDTVDTSVNRHPLDTPSTLPTLVSTSVDSRYALMLSTVSTVSEPSTLRHPRHSRHPRHPDTARHSAPSTPRHCSTPQAAPNAPQSLECSPPSRV